VYVSDRYINDELFWIDVNAPATTVRLTHSPEDELEPKYSPNGSRIAFVVEEVSYYGSPGIHVMNADGTGAIQLTGSSSDDDPAWSPDGTKIAFTRNHRLWIMNADGSGQTELINENAFDDASPAFSPDGTKLAFVRGGSNIRKIYVLNFADSSVKQLPLVPFGNQDDLDWIRRP
jgi:TolB protein